MMLHEILKETGLTRKAVEYYAAQALISPKAADNGYREFTEHDVRTLRTISVYRSLGLSVAEIKDILSGDEKKKLHALIRRKAQRLQSEQQKIELLCSIADGATTEEILPALDALKMRESIADRLADAFPGYFGRFFSFHFSSFLSSPVNTANQLRAYETIVSWLDHLPAWILPAQLNEFLDQIENSISPAQLSDMHHALMAASENPQAYFSQHESAIREYIAMKNTEEYRASPAAQLAQAMQDFQAQNGYLDVFIPAMERLSPDYARYRRRLAAADSALEDMLNTQ